MGRREAQARIAADEFAEWKVIYGHIETFGEPREDLRSAIVASTVANFAGKVLKDKQHTTPADFMPFREEEKKQTPQDQAKQLSLIQQSLGLVTR